MNRNANNSPGTDKSAPGEKKKLRISKPHVRTWSDSPAKPFPIVGIGASAGGLEAFTQFLQHLPSDSGMGFVLVQHLDPDHRSTLRDLLARTTSLPVAEIKTGLTVKPNNIYVSPPNKTVTIKGGVLKLEPRDTGAAQHYSIDKFFKSLAEDQKALAIGVVLSGMATDGTFGLEAIKAEGGITFAQDEKSASFNSMPRSAAASGCVDFVLAPPDIAIELRRLSGHPYIAPHADGIPEPMGDPGDFKKILFLLRQNSGMDFGAYKTATLHRRIHRRMALSHKSTLADYTGVLRDNPREVQTLYQDLLINVTGFFRDAMAFETLKKKVFPKINPPPSPDEPVRIWVIGCSTGQEAYSLGMCFLELADTHRQSFPVQIFATDVNEAGLEKARTGFYTPSMVADVSPERLERFFVEVEGGYRICKPLRDMCLFAKQSILSDPPFSRLDFISCRNLMIYLEQDAQKKLLPTFHYALKPGGFLWLGSSESIGGFGNLFAVEDKHHKIYSKKPVPSRPAFSFATAGRGQLHSAIGRPGEAPSSMRNQADVQREADRVLVARYAPSGVLVNAEMEAVQFRGDTGSYLKPAPGKASFNLLKMLREGLLIPVRAAIEKAGKDRQPVRRENLRVKQGKGSSLVNLEVIPLKNLPAEQRHFLLTFEPVEEPTSGVGRRQGEETAKATKPPPYPVERESARNRRLIQELADTRDYLQSVVERSDAANEELQSASEEAQSGNEELQSINEELETSKEELQASNEELSTVNEELQNRNREIGSLNNDLLNLLASSNIPILMLGRDLRIRRITPVSDKAFNVIPGDMGRSISDIKLKVTIPDLEQILTHVIDTEMPQDKEVQDHQGRWHLLSFRPYRTVDSKIEGAVMALLDIDALKKSEQDLRRARDYSEALLRSAPYPLLVLGNNLQVTMANDSFYNSFKVSQSETEGRHIYELGNGQWNLPKLRDLLEDVLPRNRVFGDFEIIHDFEHIGRRIMVLHARRVDTPERHILLGIIDITEGREMEVALRCSELRYRRLFEAAKDGILIIDPKTRKIIDANPYLDELLGFQREELLGKELYEIGVPEEEKGNQAAMRELQKQRYLRCPDMEMRTADEKRRTVEVVGNLYSEEDNQVIQLNIRDISERKQAEEALRKAKDQLADQAAHLEQLVTERTHALHEMVGELETFSYSLAHDMRAPLRGMRGFSQALLEEYSDKLDEAGNDYLQRIANSAARLDALIQDVLQYAKLLRAEVRLKPIDLDHLVRDILATYPAWKPSEAKIHIEGKLPLVLGHEGFLTQCISNLLGNAVKFSATTGQSRVNIRSEEIVSKIRVWFEDNGIGIDPADHERIFRLFERVHSNAEYEGTGIGLTIVRKAVERMGGKVGVESEFGKGSKFWIELEKAAEA